MPPPPPPAPSAAPQRLVAEAEGRRVELDWAPVEGATGYRVFRSTAGVWDPTPVATVGRSGYRFWGLTAGTLYGFKVAAFNRGGLGPQSTDVSVRPVAPPSELKATAGDRQVTLAWRASPGALTYTVYRSQSREPRSFQPVARGLTAATFVDAGLTNGRKYVYRVRAFAENSESRGSAPVWAKPVAPPTPPPATAPANLVSSLNGTSVTLTWDPVAGASSYQVFRTTNGTFGTTPAATVTTPPFVQNGLLPGTTYSYRVAATNAGGNGPVSAITSVTPQPPPSAPTGLSAAPGNGQNSLSWTAVSGATAYAVYRGTVTNAQAASPVSGLLLTPSFVDTGLTNGTAYFYKVTAFGPGGESARSAEASATPTAPPPSTDPTTLSSFRLLRQSTWGPKPGEVERVVAIGVDAFLAEQFAAAPSVYPDTLFSESPEVAQEHFMQLAMTGPDQLRQRVAFALHKIWVVSGVEINDSRALVTYYRLMMNGAFGNYRDLMRAVTLNPAMGRYLNMVNNKSAASNGGIAPNENYAREIMQLFTIGLTRLNPDGTPAVDGSGQPVPSYTEEDVKALARILTGWTYGDGNPGTVPSNTVSSPNFGVPMEVVNASRGYHDTSAKTFLGEAFPAGVDANTELDHALDVLFNHQNVAPFVSRQLIQQLVTSNPSAQYVNDVAAVFGGGARGDLAAVVRAILSHNEAALTTPTSGKLAEPVLFAVSQLRALNATVTDHPFMSDKVAEMGQRVFFPPSVFSYFSPGFRVAGTGTPPLAGPEFQGLTSVTTLVRANFVGSLLAGRFGTAVSVDYTPFTSRAAVPSDLVDYVGLVFTGGRLTPAQRSEIIAAVTATAASQPQERVRTAIYLTLVPGLSQVDR